MYVASQERTSAVRDWERLNRGSIRQIMQTQATTLALEAIGKELNIVTTNLQWYVLIDEAERARALANSTPMRPTC